MKTYIGIDNGCSGSIGIITGDFYSFYQTPSKKEQNYTKTKRNISRIDVIQLREILSLLPNPFALLERPYTGKNYHTVVAGMRALEATITFLESNDIGFAYCDSKEWQKELLPQGIKGTPELKKASYDIGLRMFPKCKDIIERQKDADGLLIAEYARRKF